MISYIRADYDKGILSESRVKESKDKEVLSMFRRGTQKGDYVRLCKEVDGKIVFL